MADLLALLQPRVADRDSLQEFIENLEDQVPAIERDIAALRKDPGDRALIARLFRALHTIKGDAAICKVDLGVMICHPIESLLARCREGEIQFSDLLAEATLLALDRLELATEALVNGRSVEHLKLPELVGGLEGMARAPAAELAVRAARTIEAVTGFKPVQSRAETTVVTVAPTAPANLAADMQFFHTLARQFEARSPLFKGRT
ncbi:MAG: Hpt domain-containing protein, partial [Rhodocyclaceae bacterium]|nr:Hpt domain-containing protein [Rhodocyclaceae bacterium]